MTLIIEADDTLSAVSNQIAAPGFGPLVLGRAKRPARTEARPAGRSSCGAVNWPSRTWGLVDALLGAASFVLGHLLSPSFDASHPNLYVAAWAAATFATCLLLAS